MNACNVYVSIAEIICTLYRCIWYALHSIHVYIHVYEWRRYESKRQGSMNLADALGLVWKYICQQTGRYGGVWSPHVRHRAPRVWPRPLEAQYMCQGLLINWLEEPRGSTRSQSVPSGTTWPKLALLMDWHSYSIMQREIINGLSMALIVLLVSFPKNTFIPLCFKESTYLYQGKLHISKESFILGILFNYWHVKKSASYSFILRPLTRSIHSV